MIIWLASYPKSGNTLLRSMLSAYFYSKEGKFDFELLKNIKQFPDNFLFEKLGIDTKNELNVVKNYIKVQEEINRRDKNFVRFLKTHSSLNDINNYQFTNLKNCLGVIYIVRDPRKIINSYANHADVSLKEAEERILNIRIIGGKNEKFNKTVFHTGSWSSNFQSWKEFKKVNRYLLVKYEDLVSKPEATFTNILKFIQKITNTKDTINKEKLFNVINTTKFDYLQNLEKKHSFLEAARTEKEVKQFFKYGPKNDGKNNLPTDIKENLEKNLLKEMNELDYL